MKLKECFFREHHREVSKQFTKYCLVGTTGFFISIATLFCFTEFFGLYYLLSACIAFGLAVSGSFILNKKYTFNECFRDRVLLKYGKFFAVSLFALGLNLSLLYLFTEELGIYYVVSHFYAIFITSCVNFSGTKLLVFN